MKMPETIVINDKQVNAMTYRKLGKVNPTVYLYENIKTGCKQCFSIYDDAVRRAKV